jgi:hypothetical protein
MKRQYAIYPLIFRATCVIIFVAGLWPFSFRADNGIAWLKGNNGIEFYDPSIIYSVGKQITLSTGKFFETNASVSVEIWLQSNTEPRSGGSSILCLYDGKLPGIIILGQWNSSLDIRTRIEEPARGRLYKAMGLRNIFPSSKKQFLTLTSGKAGTAIYVDGQIAKMDARYKLLSNKNIIPSWRLVLGNDPSGRRPWIGKIFGLAIYNKELRSETVFENYQKWIRHDQSSLSKGEGLIALYPMDERSGPWIHNSGAKIHHLWIPGRFQILKKQFLELDLMDVITKRYRYQDIIINVLGFVPFGFFGLGYFLSIQSLFGSSRRLSLLVIFIGSVMSLTIELLQVYLPNRYSSLTDLNCNTLGTAFGVALFQALMRRSKVRIHT